MRSDENFTSSAVFYRLLGAERRLFFLTLLTTGISALVALILPLATKGLVDDFRSYVLDYRKLAVFGLVLFCQIGFSTFSLFSASKVGLGIVAELRKRLWRKILNLPIAYFDEHHTGAIVSCVTNDTSMIRYLISDNLGGVVSGGITLIGGVTVLLYLDWKMSLVIFATFPILILVLAPMSRQMRNISSVAQHQTGVFSAVITRAVSEMRLVKSSGAQDFECKRGTDNIETLRLLNVSEARMSAIVTPVTSAFVMLLMVSVVTYGGLRVSSGALTVGSLVAFVMYMSQVAGPLNQVVGFINQLNKTRGATERVFSILELSEENYDFGDRIEEKGADVVFNEVSFAYDNGTTVLENISFSIPSKKVTAIVGPSGSGKTTIFSLIARFYNPTAGEIFVGSKSISDISLRDWRGNIGYVAQECPVIAGTIRENICYGMKEPVSDFDFELAVKMTGLHEFISALPERFDTVVGERGIKLSGGQRQRLAIARAILRDPDILMLDEATSNLDSESESVVQTALTGPMKGRTTIIIAHRLSTIIHADQIIFVEHGRVTGAGTHQYLLNAHDKYKKFVDMQFRFEGHGHTSDDSADRFEIKL